MMTLPRFEKALPELFQFVTRLAAQRRSGEIDDWPGFIQQVHDFYTPQMMAKIERVAPGWGEMASYLDEQTLIHVTSVLAALLLLEEYQAATAEQQVIMQWMVLYHDVGKIPVHGKHDFVHGFRSAVMAGRALAGAGFPVNDRFPALIDDWAALTYEAVMWRADIEEMIQDNGKLPQIYAGIAQMYGAGSPAAQIIKGVLLHLSIATDPEYPTVAPLSDEEVRQYIDSEFFPLMKMMMLVDADGWNFFDPATRQRHRGQTLATYERLGKLIGM